MIPVPAVSAAGEAAAADERSYLSVFGDASVNADFKAFSYVRPDAPKGGRLSMAVFGTFNSLNAYILEGDPAFGMELVFDSLMSPSLDDPNVAFPFVAHSVSISPDRTLLRFRLRREARFHDGSPLTSADVVFSLNVLKRHGPPSLRLQLKAMESVAADGEDAVVIRLAPRSSRQLPLTIARQPIFSAAHYKGVTFEQSSLVAPLGSGPYKVERFEAGRFISFARVPDYWARCLPVNVGHDNFDTIKFEYFRDRNVAFEAFKAGALTIHQEFTAARWKTGYDFPAARAGRVLRAELPDSNISGVQGWFFNTRRTALSDPRVREALGCAFDFIWTNRNLLYDAYRRTQSYFENSDMEAVGPPDERQMALLEPFRGKAPDEVFAEPFLSPDGDGSGRDRALLKRATDLLTAAGYSREGAVLTSSDGSPLELEILDSSNALDRVTLPFVRNLRFIGVRAHLRVVDAAQYRKRLQQFDFDITPQRIVMSNAPAEELQAIFGSEAAQTNGSRNIVGVSDPVVDALLQKALAADQWDELVAVCRAIDRVLRAGRYWIPHWYKSAHWVAHWNLFGRPERTPKFAPAVISTWWWDSEKAEQTALSHR